MTKNPFLVYFYKAKRSKKGQKIKKVKLIKNLIMTKNKEGFTLIELLVVVAIIGILAGIAFLSISGARETAFDATIQSELSQVRSAAEQFYYDQGGTYTPDGADAFDESDAWNRFATDIPPCSVDLMDLAGIETTDADGEEYQIVVRNQAFAAWAPLCAASDGETADDLVYWCVDSTGDSGRYGGTIDTDDNWSCEDIFENSL